MVHTLQAEWLHSTVFNISAVFYFWCCIVSSSISAISHVFMCEMKRATGACVKSCFSKKKTSVQKTTGILISAYGFDSQFFINVCMYSCFLNAWIADSQLRVTSIIRSWYQQVIWVTFKVYWALPVSEHNGTTNWTDLFHTDTMKQACSTYIVASKYAMCLKDDIVSSSCWMFCIYRHKLTMMKQWWCKLSLMGVEAAGGSEQQDQQK